MAGGRVQTIGAQVHQVHRRVTPAVGVHISPEHTTRRSVFHEDRIGRGIQGAAGAPQAEHPRAAQPHALDDLDAAVSGAQVDTTWQAIDGFLGCKIDATGEVLAGVAVAVEEAHVQVEGFVHGGDARTEEAQQARCRVVNDAEGQRRAGADKAARTGGVDSEQELPRRG